MHVHDSLLKEVVSFATSHKAHELNQLLIADNKYSFALEKCLQLGYISGISSCRNANGIPVFQELENYSVTDDGIKFLEKSASSTDL